jgi:SNF2 family DNA or RNA helicase
MHGDALTHLRQVVEQRPLAKLAHLVAWGPLIQECDDFIVQDKALEERSKKQNKKRRKDAQSSAKKLTKEASDMRSDQAREELERLRERHEVFDVKLEALGAPVLHRPRAASSAAGKDTAPERLRLLKLSPVAEARVGRSCSSKINFILEEVRASAYPREQRAILNLLQRQVFRYSQDKFLIFSASALSLLYVKEALDLHNIPCLDFSSQVKRDARQQNVITFETSDHCRVFLIELKQGARGL